MPRNLVICFDGTSNEFGPVLTNVVRLVKVLEFNPDSQLVHYAPGVGTLPEPGYVSWLQQKFSLMTGLAFGAGLHNIASEAYSFLMDYWEPGDRVYLYGFSRGAYTARVLAAWLHVVGLLPRGNQNMIPYAWRLFASLKGSDEHSANQEYWKLCNDFRKTYARPIIGSGVHEGERRFRTHFVGVWDTVSSVGWVWNPKSYPYSAKNPGIGTIRHAIAIDERRCFFRQNVCYSTPGQDLQQRWFAGSHGDVGGGYPEKESQNWRNSFDWMLKESTQAQLRVNPEALAELNNGATEKPWLEKIHDSLIWPWTIAEYIPRMRWDPVTKKQSLKMGLGQPRSIIWPGQDLADIDPQANLLHKSAMQRIKEDPSYRPPNLPKAFIDKVLNLNPPPDELAVTP